MKKKMRVLMATAGAALVMAAFPAPAQASHRCLPPEGEDDHGISHTLWVACEYGPHDPVGVVGYIVCWLSPTC